MAWQSAAVGPTLLTTAGNVTLLTVPAGATARIWSVAVLEQGNAAGHTVIMRVNALNFARRVLLQNEGAEMVVNEAWVLDAGDVLSALGAGLGSSRLLVSYQIRL